MRPIKLARSLLAVALLVVMAVPAGAQGIKLEASLAYVSLGGDDFEFTGAGMGFDVAAIFSTPAKLSIAAGLQRSSHEFDDNSGDMAALQIYAEPRMTLGMMTGPVSPYLFGRVGWVRASGDLGGADASQSGFGFGGGIGMRITTPGSISWHASVGIHSISLGDAEVDGSTIPDSDASGSAMVLRGGVSFSFGASMLNRMPKPAKR